MYIPSCKDNPGRFVGCLYGDGPGLGLYECTYTDRFFSDGITQITNIAIHIKYMFRCISFILIPLPLKRQIKDNNKMHLIKLVALLLADDNGSNSKKKKTLYKHTYF